MDTTTTTGNPSGKRSHRRQNRIINPVFQWKYTLLLSGSVFFVSTFMSVILFAALQNQARARLVNPEASYMWENTLVMVLSAVVFSAVTAGAVGFWCIILTHRVAGPLYVLDRHLGEIIRGRLPKVRALRKKDEFKELHDSFRMAVDTLRIRQQDDLATLTEMLSIAESSSTDDETKLRNALEDIAGHVARLRAQAAEVLGEEVDSIPAETGSGPVQISNAKQAGAEVGV